MRKLSQEQIGRLREHIAEWKLHHPIVMCAELLWEYPWPPEFELPSFIEFVHSENYLKQPMPYPRRKRKRRLAG